MFKKFKESAYWKAALLLLAVGGILIVFNNWINKATIAMSFGAINDALMPFYFGVIFALLLCPVYNWIVSNSYAKMLKNSENSPERIGYYVRSNKGKELTNADRRSCLALARVLASIACLVIVLGLMALIVYAIVPQFLTSSIELIETMPERLMKLSKWTAVHMSRFPFLSKWLADISSTGGANILKWVQTHLIKGSSVDIATAISTGVLNALNSILDIIIGVLIMIYLLNYKEKLFAIGRKFLSATCKQKTQDGILEFTGVMNDTFIGFIVGRIIDSFIIGLLTYVVLLICGISFAPMISVVVGVTNVIPFFGPFIGAIPSTVILLLEDPIEAVWFVVIILIIQQLDGNVIGPKIVGNVIGIDSFWVLVSVLIGGSLFGFVGMVFGVPVFAVIYRYVDKLTIRNLRKQGKPTHTSDYYTLQQYGVDASDVDLEEMKLNDKSFLRKFHRTRAVEEELIEEAAALELENAKKQKAAEIINREIDQQLEAGQTVPESLPEETIEELKERLRDELLESFKENPNKESESNEQ